jgi:hypothetical protein
MSSASSSAGVGDKRLREHSAAAGSSAAAGEMPRRVQPRHFHCGRNPMPGEDMLAALQDEAGTPLLTSTGRLYRHALESVLAFCSLKELAPLLRVSKEWASAVHSMRSLSVDLPYTGSDARLLRFCLSPLSRHVSKVHVPMFPLSCWSLYHIQQRMPNLQQLHCEFQGSWLPLMFPARLRNLTVRFLATAAVTAPFSDRQHRELDEAVVAIAALPFLEELSIIAEMARTCCLTPLATTPSLHTLTLAMPERVLDSSANIDALRSMPHLRSLSFRPSPAAFTSMLQPPHSMQLESLAVFPLFTAEFGASIVHLPSLTELHLELSSPHTDFLRSLPNLRNLNITSQECTVLPDAGRVMASLHSLVGLTELQIEGNVHADLQFPFLFT